MPACSPTGRCRSPTGGADKETRGAMLVIAGSAETPGAAALAATAALRAGAGKLTVATAARSPPAWRWRCPKPVSSPCRDARRRPGGRRAGQLESLLGRSTRSSSVPGCRMARRPGHSFAAWSSGDPCRRRARRAGDGGRDRHAPLRARLSLRRITATWPISPACPRTRSAPSRERHAREAARAGTPSSS